MKNANWATIMSFFLVVLAIGLILMVVLYVNLRRKLDSQIERLQHQETVVEWVQSVEIQRLIERVRKVMQGEIIYERGTDALAEYSHISTRDRLGQDLYAIKSDLRIVDLRLDEDKGQAIVTYHILYLNSEGEILMGISADSITPDRWILEKQDGDWVIVEIGTVWEYKTGELELGESVLRRAVPTSQSAVPEFRSQEPE